MGTEVQIVAFCDRCKTRGSERDFAMSVPLALGDHRREIDLCQGCLSELTSSMGEFMEVSRPPAPKKRRSRKPINPDRPEATVESLSDRTCEFCGSVRKNLRAKRMHQGHSHKEEMAKARAAASA